MLLSDYILLKIFFIIIIATTAAAKSLASTHYIIGECNEGLANRLRLLLSLIHASQVLHNNSHVFMVWDINDACPGHFLQLYKPFKQVTFITSTSKKYFVANATMVYPPSAMGIRLFCDTYDIPYRFSLDIKLWTQLTPVQSIEDRVNAYVKENNICGITAMHIRKTDLEETLLHKKRTSIVKFFEWVESQPPAEPVYLLTDNPTTQSLFLQKYGGDKIKVYKNMTAEGLQRPINDSTKLILVRQNYSFVAPNINISAGNSMICVLQIVYTLIQYTIITYICYVCNIVQIYCMHVGLPFSHRYTNLEHTVIDALIATRARKFRMSAFSSLSEYIDFTRRKYRFIMCGRW